jgi:two-component system response regulator YesN
MREMYMAQDEISSQNSDLSYVLDYIYKNYRNDISFRDICAQLNYSEPHLSIKFKRRFGMTYTQYLQKFRIKQSMHLLSNTEVAIDQVAELVGYRDLKAFYAAFKKYTATTPAKFRKKSLER